MNKRKRYEAEPRCVVAVWVFNRACRDPALARNLESEFELRGVKIPELANPPPTGNPVADDVLSAVKRQTDLAFLDDLSRDVRRGQAANLGMLNSDPAFRKYNPDWPTCDGRYLGIADGTPPMGFKGKMVQIGVRSRYRSDHKGEEVEARIVQCLVIDEAKWALCRLAWEMRHAGRSYREIHQATNLYTNVNSYSNFFRNRIYTGDYEHSKRVYEHFVPALIPREWYEQEQAIRAERGRKRTGEALPPGLEPRIISSQYLLSGRLFCGAKPDELHPMHGHSAERCPFYGASRAAVDTAVLDLLFGQVLTRDNLRPLVAELNTHLAARQTTHNAQLENIKQQIHEAERQRRKYARLIDLDPDPSPTLVTELKGYEKRKAALLDEKRRLETDQPRTSSSDQVTDAQLDDYLAKVRQTLAGDDVTLARRILDHFVEKVVIHGKTGTLYYTFPTALLSSLRTPSLEGMRPYRGLYAAEFEIVKLPRILQKRK